MENKVKTIKDVAKICKVSVSTVSRAFNNYSDISEKTRERILKMSEEIGYKPNIVAKSLSSIKNYRLAMLVEDYSEVNPLTYEMLMPFQNMASNRGYETVLLSTTSNMQKSHELKKLLSDKQVDGAFIIGLKMNDDYYKQLSNINIPCVLYDININNEKTSCVGVDNVKGAFMAVEHLIKLRHKKIGFINGHKNAQVSFERLDGYYLALNRYDIPVDNKLIVNGNFSFVDAQIAVKELLGKNKDITAIFCASDLMAAGAISKLQELGYSLPDDLSIIGFDDENISQYISPKLTTIRQHRDKIGETAANVLINIISGQSLSRNVIEPELIIRESCKELNT
ncbi:LacI family DNA-binding transcriptional regulator [Clostridium psychrophilum]|uniref:LacI family DNA-binding transcriptional regulator n=1 Tax=Clostridium psychrophilum TaxID=132926 RepID=UPI001C0D22D9|nr:LacI family DNA-binding transcriptional regulator [Clostridium psychrophilum]MBU3180185.1 LacI family transcriptional regulator [Clostridium psychrophilum]